MKLILATNNRNKLREISQSLEGAGISVISQAQAGIDIDVEENGTTFAENAAIKASAIAEILNARGERCYVLADDSGLCVDALSGEPGVYSHRWAGTNADDADRIRKLLDALKDIPDSERGAQFVCDMCLIAPDGSMHAFEGVVRGVILHAPSGENGFGYDPVFGYGDRSFAELSAEEKNSVSHRRNALIQVLDYFQSL